MELSGFTITARGDGRILIRSDMEATEVTCPTCRTSFPLNAAIEQPIVERLRAQFMEQSAKRDAQLAAREKALTDKAERVKQSEAELQSRVKAQVAARLEERLKQMAIELEQKAKQTVHVELDDLKQQVAEKSKLLATAEQKELALLKLKRELESAKASFEIEKAKQLEAERKEIAESAGKAARESIEKEMAQLKQAADITDKRLKIAENAELEIRKQKVEWEAEKRAFDLQIARNAEEVKQAVAKDKDEEYRLREAEKNKQMEDMRKQIDELRRKADQGSQQSQGEVLELDLEGALRRCFAADEIVPVPKGIHGGDLLHKVRDEFGRECGTIIWETKRTKAWQDSWLTKLKDDKLAAKAQISVLVSVTMPSDAAQFECRENVWIAPPPVAVALAGALRMMLCETASARRAAENRHDKMAAIYDYFAGSEFKERVTAIFDSFTAMRNQLDGERRAIQKIWAAREKQIDRVLANTVGLHGDLQGIIGPSLPAISGMELEALARDAEGNGDGVVATRAEMRNLL
jgi:hypothetical protein